MLSSHEARPFVRSAFLGYGRHAVEFLDEALSDGALPIEIRRHVPRTLSRFQGEQAIPVLQRHLVEEVNGLIRFHVLRGLGRAATNNPDVPLDRRVIQSALDRTLEACFRLAHWQQTLRRGADQEKHRRTDGHGLLLDLLRDKQAHALERAFRILTLMLRDEDVRSIHRGLRSSKPKVRAGSRELLEAITEPPMRGALLALVDDAPGADPVASAVPYFEARPLGYEELLGVLLQSSGETLRCIAAYHVGELGLRNLGGQLEALKTRETGFFVTRVVERALKLLSAPPGRELAPAR
jgi:hypothetical protein